MILTKGQEIPELESEKFYSIKLAKHRFISIPLVKGKNLEERMRQLSYYNDNGTVENVEIDGPFEYLNW
jgi:hypothetical protein